MSHHHITTFERGSIQELKNSGYTNREIAKKMKRHHSSIDRELKRNSNERVYECEAAQKTYEKRRKNSKPNGKKTETLITEITEKLAATWSPEQIANTVTKNKVSYKTIYNWIYRGYLPSITPKNLRQKGKRRKGEKRGKFSMGTPISERPKEVKSRVSFGHWELDSVVSSRGESKGCFATFVERKSRLYTAIKTPDRTASSMKSAITQFIQCASQRSFSQRYY